MWAIIKEMFSSLILTIPIMFAVSIQMIMGLVSTLMLSKLGVRELAVGGLAVTIYLFAFATGIGLLSVVSALISKAVKQNDYHRIAEVLSYSWWIIIIYSSLAIIVIMILSIFFQYIAVEKSMRFDFILYIFIMLLGLLPALFFTLLRSLVTSFSKPITAMIFMIPFVIFNFGLDYILMYGKYGFPCLGMQGISVSTALTSFLMAGLFYWYVANSKYYKLCFSKKITRWLGRYGLLELYKLGWPMGLSFLLLFGVITIASVIIGHYGINDLASNQIILQCVDIVFIIGISLAQSAMVRMGYALGGDNHKQLSITYYSTLALSIILSIGIIFIFIFWGKDLIGIFIAKPKIINFTYSLLIIAGLFNFFRTIQVVSASLLVNFNQTKYCFYTYLASYWLIGMFLMIGVVIFIKNVELGIWCALTLSACLSSIILVIKLRNIINQKH